MDSYITDVEKYTDSEESYKSKVETGLSLIKKKLTENRKN